jgi:hypothetical protein
MALIGAQPASITENARGKFPPRCCFVRNALTHQGAMEKDFFFG